MKLISSKKPQFMLQEDNDWVLVQIECPDNDGKLQWVTGRYFGQSLEKIKQNLLGKGCEQIYWTSYGIQS